jgi:hypothetical protein
VISKSDLSVWEWALETKTTNWIYTEADSFWMEEDPPSNYMHHYYFDYTEVSRYTRNLLHLLGSLRVIDYGCSYEHMELIRIRDVRRN